MSTLGRIHSSKKVVEDVDYGGYVFFRLAKAVLEGGVEGAGECSGVHAFAMVLHMVGDGVVVLFDHVTGQFFESVGKIAGGFR